MSPMQTDSQWMHTLCVAELCGGPEGLEWAGLSQAQALSNGSAGIRCVARLIYGTSLSQCIPSPCGPGGRGARGPSDSQEQSGALGGAQRSQGEQLQFSPSDSTSLPGRKHLIQHISAPSVSAKDTYCSIYRSENLVSFNSVRVGTVMKMKSKTQEGVLTCGTAACAQSRQSCVV